MFLLFVAKSDDLNYLVFVQVLKARASDDFVMVLLSEEKTCLFESLTVEGVGVFEDLADTFHRDLLCQNLLTPLLEGWYVEAVGQLHNWTQFC